MNLCEHRDSHLLPSAVRQRHHTTNQLVGLARVYIQLDHLTTTASQ